MPKNPERMPTKAETAKQMIRPHAALLALALVVAGFWLAAAGFLLPGLLAAVAAGALANE